MAIAGLPTTAGNDTVTVTPSGFYSVNGGDGIDTLVVNYQTLAGDVDYSYAGSGWWQYTDSFFNGVSFYGFERFILLGGSGDDRLNGAGYDDQLFGRDGNDLINSGLGADYIDGGAGNDRWTADYSSVLAAVAVTLTTGAAWAAVTGTGAHVRYIESVNLTTGIGNDLINTTAFVGNDAVNSGDGDDIVNLGRGNDSANGNLGTDTLVMDWHAISNANQGIGFNYAGNGWWDFSSASGDRLHFIGFERYQLTGGAGADNLVGGGANDRLVGGLGNDTLNGGAGVDTVYGGGGVDTWLVDTTARVGNTAVNLGTQTANTGALLGGIEQINYTGGAMRDFVTANAGVFNDVFHTGGGDDTVTTGRGHDSADGGLGAYDTLVMNWSTISDPLQGIAHSYQGNGWYRFAATSGDQLDFIGFEQFALVGGAGADQLVGGGLDDWLYGGAGNDTLAGDFGNGKVDGGTGVDRWTANLSDRVTTVTFNATASQSAAQTVVAGLTVRNIEAIDLVTGAAGDNISTLGFALDDHVTTNAGDDAINPGRGYDSVDAGAGVDRLFLNYSAATTSVSTRYIGNGWNRYGDQADTSHVDYIGIESFAIAGGSGNDQLTGGDLGDVLSGGTGDDVLNGGAGADSIYGGLGNDTWVGNFRASVNTLNLTMNAAGAGALAGAGVVLNSIENVSLVTGANSDTVNLGALAGNDSITTGGGNDVINIGRGLHESVDGGADSDTLIAAMSMADGGVRMAYVGNGWYGATTTTGSYRLDFIGIETFNLTGSAYNDRLNGFDGNDSLSGGAGSDILEGRGGNDVLTGGLGVDQFLFSAPGSSGVDTITDAVSGDFLRLAGVTLNGSVAAGTGGELLAGGVQANTAGGVTTLYVGLDETAGYDFAVLLTGAYAPGSFALSGGDIILV